MGFAAGRDEHEKSRPYRDSIPAPSGTERVAIPTELFWPPDTVGTGMKHRKFEKYCAIHTTLTRGIHALGGIRTRDPSTRAAADPRLRTRATEISTVSCLQNRTFIASNFPTCPECLTRAKENGCKDVARKGRGSNGAAAPGSWVEEGSKWVAK